MRRREFIGFVGGAVATWPLAVRAEQAGGRRLAIFSPFEPAALMSETGENRYYRALFAELRRLGHVEGQNLTVDRYGRERGTSGLPALAADVIRARPDVVYVVGPDPKLFKEAADKIAVVALTGDPVGQGLIQSLAHPGGNITGVSVDAGPSIHGKRIALLSEMFPGLSRLAYVTLRRQWEGGQGRDISQAGAAAGIGVVPHLVDVPTSEAAYGEAIRRAASDGANAFMVGDNPDTMAHRAVIATLIAAAAMPAIYPFEEFVEAGGLMGYSFDLVELNKRAANNIDAVLRGANPGDIPFYQASKFELSLNLKTAKMLGLAGAAATWPLAARAQQATRVARVAWAHPSASLANMREDGEDKVYAAFPQELRRLGHTEGTDLILDRYSGEGRREEYAALARRVVQSQPAVIFTSGTDMTRHFAAATSTLPIVAVLTDPVATGLIANLAHPERNITGTSVDAGIEIWSKRLAVLKEVLPTASRLGFLSSRSYWDGVGQSGEASRGAAAKLGMSLVGCLLHEDVDEADYRRVFAAMAEQHLDALVVSEQVEHRANRKAIIALTQQFRVPAVFAYRDFVELGGLMAYAVDLAGAFRLAARQVDRILKGSRPSELPFLQQTRFELLINLATAKTLDINVPPALLASADEVIE